MQHSMYASYSTIILGLLVVMPIWVCVRAAGSGNCSYQGVLAHVGLSTNINTTLSHIRPVWTWTEPTIVYVNLYLQGIIEVDEKAQSFSPQVYIVVGWINEFTRWTPEDFCGIGRISVPKDRLWMPDLTITENIETEAGMKESPYAQLLPGGVVYTSDSYRMTTSCRMDLYKFPFDTQRCTITLISFIYPIEELRLMSAYNASTVTENSRKMFQSMGEWELINVDISRVNLTIGVFVWDQLVYMVSMGRRPLLYVVNFLLPVLYFLLLDLASFFISERGGEKLSFKVTVLLAISVLLLILHDMLPSTDQHIPLIGIYCLGIFSFVALSLLETIFVSFLLRTGSRRARTATSPAVTPALTPGATPEGSPDSEQGVDVDKGTWTCGPDCGCVTRLAEGVCVTRLAEGVCVTRLARVIDVIYFLSYLASVTIFLLLTTLNWFY